jgi:predicted  nucleic acid-binding Zn-ribbon protein
MEDEQTKSIAILETEVKHINKHLGSIDATMKKLQEIVIEQNDLRREMQAALKEHGEMRKELSGYGKRLSDNETKTKELKTKFENQSMKLKSNIVDYVWKYAALAIGGWIALKITGILP